MKQHISFTCLDEVRYQWNGLMDINAQFPHVMYSYIHMHFTS